MVIFNITNFKSQFKNISNLLVGKFEIELRPANPVEIFEGLFLTKLFN